MSNTPKIILACIAIWLGATALVLFFNAINLPTLAAMTGVGAIPAIIITFAVLTE